MVANPDDESAIHMAAMDYEEGWFEGDAERMARCLHPELAKRALSHDSDTGEEFFNHITREDMILDTKAGGGTNIPREKLYYKIDILEIYEETAVVRAESFPYIDHLHLVKDGGQWLIVNVLYTANRANRV